MGPSANIAYDLELGPPVKLGKIYFDGPSRKYGVLIGWAHITI